MDIASKAWETLASFLGVGRAALESRLDGHQWFLTLVGGLVSAYYGTKLVAFVVGELKVVLFGRWLAVDLAKQGKWAVVTGATDGIGKAYCKELANRGLNIVLLGRSPEKLANVSKEIGDASGVQVKCLKVDFSHGPEIYTDIEDQLQGLDIGVLVNNVGMTREDELLNFTDSDKKWYSTSLSVNLQSALMMTRIVLPGMQQRRRGVLLNISSASIYLKRVGTVMYYMTKVALDNFTEVLRMENEVPGITIQSVTPMFVQSKMTKHVKEELKDSVFYPSADDYVRGQLKTVGLQDRTLGYWSHVVQYVLFCLPPSCVTTWAYNRRMKRLQAAKMKSK